MGRFSRHLLLHWLPGLLRMRPHKTHRIGKSKNGKVEKYEEDDEEKSTVRVQIHRTELTSTRKRRPSENTLTRIGLSREICRDLASAPMDERLRQIYYSPLIIKAMENIDFIGQILKKENSDNETEKEWEYVANVVDRLFLWIFSVICVVGTVWIFGQAPIFYDNRLPYMATNSSNQIIETLEDLVHKIDKNK